MINNQPSPIIHYFLQNDGIIKPFWRLILFIIAISFVYLNQPLIAIPVVLFFTRNIDKRSFVSLGYSRHRGWIISLSTGLAMGFSLMGIIFTFEYLLGWIEVKGIAWNTRPDVLSAIAVSILHMLIVSISEETVFRGYILQHLETLFGLRIAVIVSSVLFAVLHLFNPTQTQWAFYFVPLSITIIGIMLALSYLVFRSLWMPIALHFSWNFCLFDVFGLAGANSESATFLITELHGPAYWIGLPDSSFGPESGFFSIIASLVGIVIIWLMMQWKHAYANKLQ